MSAPLDEPRSVRAGEELGLASLTAYLRSALPELARASELTIDQFPSGHSNLTYLVRAGEREYVLRRPPFGSKVKSAHDMGREYRILSKLHVEYPLAPEPLVYCEDEGVLGAPFYLMRRIRGLILRRDFPPGVSCSPAEVRRLHEALVDNLARLHALDYERAGLGELGRPSGYVARQVAGWTARYATSQTDEVAALDEVAARLARELPAEGRPALIHNDYKLDNLVLDAGDPTRIVGVLDWEMSTLGEPLMDLGTSLSYWVERDDGEALQRLRSGPTSLPGSLTRGELAARYANQSGRELSAVVWFYGFGLFKTAVVLQQIYYRFVKGLTRDPRFASLGEGVRALAERAREALEQGAL